MYQENFLSLFVSVMEFLADFSTMHDTCMMKGSGPDSWVLASVPGYKGRVQIEILHTVKGTVSQQHNVGFCSRLQWKSIL
jgi:hypothetical protein